MKSLITILKIAFIGLLIFGAVRSFGQSAYVWNQKYGLAIEKVKPDTLDYYPFGNLKYYTSERPYEAITHPTISSDWQSPKYIFSKEAIDAITDSLVAKWVGYKKLCFADSKSKYHKKGEHRKPTFSGFMQYLKQRSNIYEPKQGGQ